MYRKLLREARNEGKGGIRCVSFCAFLSLRARSYCVTRQCEERKMKENDSFRALSNFPVDKRRRTKNVCDFPQSPPVGTVPLSLSASFIILLTHAQRTRLKNGKAKKGLARSLCVHTYRTHRNERGRGTWAPRRWPEC